METENQFPSTLLEVPLPELHMIQALLGLQVNGNQLSSLFINQKKFK